MCKKVNIFFPFLILFYVGGSYLINFVSGAGTVPVWLALLESQALVLIPVIAFVIGERINVAKCLPYRLPRPFDALLALFLGYAMVPAMLLLNFISMLFSTNKIQETTGALTAFPFLMQVMFIAVLPACVEEFVFRGVFYHSYRKNGIMGAALLSGFIFGIMHMNINQFIYAFVLGIVFALLVEATGSMFTAMIAHFAINTYSIIILQLVPGALKSSAESTAALRESSAASLAVAIGMLGVLALVFGSIAFIIFRQLALRNDRWLYLKAELKKGLRPQNGERFITVPLAVTIVACIIYMVGTEYFF